MRVSGANRIARAAALSALVLGGWMALMAALPFIGPAGRQVAVVAPPAVAIATIRAAGGEVVGIGARATLARSRRPGFAAALYRAGAPLVVEGRIAAGCLAITPARR